MIPYFELTYFSAGPLRLRTFAVITVVAILIARWALVRRARSQGFDPEKIHRLFVCMLSAGFTGSIAGGLHFSWTGFVPTLVRFDGISSTAGLACGALTALPWFLFERSTLTQALRVTDLFGYAAPLSCAAGRLACVVRHEHRGAWTNSWIGVRFPEGTRFDLAFVEFCGLAAMAIAFYFIDRRSRRPGFWTGLFLTAYPAVRVGVGLLKTEPPGPMVWFWLGIAAVGAAALLRSAGDGSPERSFLPAEGGAIQPGGMS